MIELYNDDCINLMQTLPDESIDVICIDPPYLYLKNQKLERAFLEFKFFSELERLVIKDGFVVMFGRGKSFYRWNNLIASFAYHKKTKERGFLMNIEDGVYYFKGNLVDEKEFKYVFDFKEEIIWNKSYSSSPLMAISRVHETVSMFTKGNGIINRSKVPYLEMKRDDISSICQDIKRMRTILKNPKSLQAVEDFLANNQLLSDDSKVLSTTISGGYVKVQDRSAAVMSILNNGLNEKTIIRSDVDSLNISEKGLRGKCSVGDRAANAMQSLEYGLNEKTVIKEVRDHYSAIHPTQKPVRLIERLLALVIPKQKPIDKVVVADFFGGSFSTMEAVHNIGCKGIACEIDEEYFNAGKKRIDNLKKLFSK